MSALGDLTLRQLGLSREHVAAMTQAAPVHSFMVLVNGERKELEQLSRRELEKLAGDCLALVPAKRNRFNTAKLFSLVANSFGVLVQELKARGRQPQIALARHVAMYVMRTHYRLSLNETARVLGYDHRNVLYAEQRIRTTMETDLGLRLQITQILSAL